MEKVIIVKYAELNTKKDNIGLFLKTLQKNIKSKLDDVTITFDKGRMYLKSDDIENSIKVLKNTFGIHEIAIGNEIEGNNLKIVKENLKQMVEKEEFKTFKIITKRSDKNYSLTSPMLNKELGELVLKTRPDVKVDVNDPELKIYVEIRKTNSYIYFKTIKGLGGYPIGTLGKGLLMLSGGIDSPVAGYLTMKRGVKIECIYFDSPPHTSENAKLKVLNLIDKLQNYQNNIKLHVIQFTKIQETIYKEVPKEYMITIMRRMMYRISERIARKNNCKILINGESIGQVASQTLESIAVINETVKIPVIRPVACFDKLEIIDLAKKINTYEISILPYQDCCTIFVPKHPVIHPNIEECIEYEKKLNIEELIKSAVKNEIIIKNNIVEFNDYL